jgi:3-hydroxyacyl-[acyl-carrier-protein] dehydratase
MNLTLDEIRRRLPHAPPFLFLDEVTEIDEAAATAIGVKRFGADEPLFAGHFPGDPIVPGCIITEALAQLSGLLLGAVRPVSGLVTLARVDMKFRRLARPDETLTLRTRHLRSFDNLHGFSVHCTLDGGDPVADGELTLATGEP